MIFQEEICIYIIRILKHSNKINRNILIMKMKHMEFLQEESIDKEVKLHMN